MVHPKCKGCPDRSADPNCHSELCPHGWSEYAEWKQKKYEERARGHDTLNDLIQVAKRQRRKKKHES